jgi:hypothetical protein
MKFICQIKGVLGAKIMVYAITFNVLIVAAIASQVPCEKRILFQQY